MVSGRQNAIPALCVALALLLLLGLIALAQPPLPLGGSYLVLGRSAAETALAVENAGGRVTSRLPVIDGVGAWLTPRQLGQIQADAAVVRVMANAAVRTASVPTSASAHPAVGVATETLPTADYPEVVGAEIVWDAAEGATGDQVTVALLDTGVDTTLPGLNRDANNRDRLNLGIVVLTDTMTVTNRLRDDNGHGTHMAGIIASSQQGEDGRWNGVAPNVEIISVQVLGEDGWGTYESVIRGIQWVLDHREAYQIGVMNLSLVATPQSPYWADPINQAVMQAWADGIVVVAAAGNSGPAPMTIGVPGNTPYIITVGAFTDDFSPEDWSDDYLAPFSAAGPTLDAFAKPDVVAPGAHILSTMKNNTYLARQHPEFVRIGGTHFEMAGTSQAAAVVSGIVALILSHPDNAGLTPDQVKYRLMHAALLWIDPQTEDAVYSVWQQGAGRVNAPDAVFTTTVAAANYGISLTTDLNDPGGGYQGYTTYDPATGSFTLLDAPETWNSGYGLWAGGYGLWAGGYGLWAGGYGLWAGGYGLWAGGYGLWAGGFGTWAGGYGLWAGGYTNWLGNGRQATVDPPWPSMYNDPQFIGNYLAGVPPAPEAPVMWDEWVEESLQYLPLIRQ